MRQLSYLWFLTKTSSESPTASNNLVKIVSAIPNANLRDLDLEESRAFQLSLIDIGEFPQQLLLVYGTCQEAGWVCVCCFDRRFLRTKKWPCSVYVEFYVKFSRISRCLQATKDQRICSSYLSTIALSRGFLLEVSDPSCSAQDSFCRPKTQRRRSKERKSLMLLQVERLCVVDVWRILRMSL